MFIIVTLTSINAEYIYTLGEWLWTYFVAVKKQTYVNILFLIYK